MEIRIQKSNIRERLITFELNGEIMVNATEMARPFGKQPATWLRLPSANDYLNELVKLRKSQFDDLVITRRGGYAGSGFAGTWFHRDVTIEFARWLASAFAIWCNDRDQSFI